MSTMLSRLSIHSNKFALGGLYIVPRHNLLNYKIITTKNNRDCRPDNKLPRTIKRKNLYWNKDQ